MGFVIEWHPSPNFSSREGRTPIAIVDHITAGAFPGCQDWLCDPAAQASAGYIVTKIGRIIQLVKDGAKAWHAGVVNKPSWVLYDGSNPNVYHWYRARGTTRGYIDTYSIPGNAMAAPAVN